MTRDNTAAQAARRQSTEGRPENQIEKTFYVISELFYPNPEIRGCVGEKMNGDSVRK